MRPVKACSHCRQFKVKCDANSTYPKPCSHCQNRDLNCSIDPKFKPRKGGQVELLREDIYNLREQIDRLKRTKPINSDPEGEDGPATKLLRREILTPPTTDNDIDASIDKHLMPDSLPSSLLVNPIVQSQSPTANQKFSGARPDRVYELENIGLTESEATKYHKRFILEYLPYIPIFESESAAELHSQSETLFWVVILTASNGDAQPDLYLKLVEPVRRLCMRVCWIETPRSTLVVQALLVLGMWPLPNEKMLDDMSMRFSNLARVLGLQLGIHRGKFIYEFSRKQKLIPNAVKWRTRTHIATFILSHFLSAQQGLPCNVHVDYLVNQGLNDKELPDSMRAILKLAVFYSKMVSIMGADMASPDGLMEPRQRRPTLEILLHDLQQIECPKDTYVQVIYLYVRCMLGCFVFLPDTPESDQTKFVTDVFNSATQLVTIVRTMVGKRKITEFPSLIRHATSFATMLLFRLHLAPQFPQEYCESARHSVVTVHYLYRNVPSAWNNVQSDVTRIAKLMEGLNNVLVSHPYLLTGQRRIMSRMRSHLTNSIFYELLWAVHEARRRNTKQASGNVPQPLKGPVEPSETPNVMPLPLYNEISADEYSTFTFTSPNGTTTSKLVPAKRENDYNVPVAGSEMPTLDLLLDDIDWMKTEGDDFLGWMP